MTNTTYTLKELEAIMLEIKFLIEKNENTSNYNWLVRDLNYYTRLANKIQAGA